MRHLLPIIFFLISTGSAAACFGPKLYIGSGGTAEEELLFAVVSLYIKEKTGTECVRVPLERKSALAEIEAERVDLAFLPAAASARTILLAVPGWPRLVSGRRPLEDLQFTTVAPALEKLNRLLAAGHLEPAKRSMAEGESAAVAARRLLTREGWL